MSFRNGFDGCVAVITGAGSGIGRELALALAEAGARLALLDRDEAGLQATAEATGRDCLLQPCDVADEASVQAAAQAVLRRFGHVNLLFNNAGIFTGGAVWRSPSADWARCFAVNVLGIGHAYRHFLPPMIAASEPAHIVNTASAGGLISVGGFGVYAASKQAVVSLSETLLRDLEAEGVEHIGVSVVCPAFVKTGIFDPREDNFARSDDARKHLEASRAAGDAGKLSAGDIARITLEGILDNRFYIIPHRGSLPAVKARMTDILEGRLPSDPMNLPVG